MHVELLMYMFNVSILHVYLYRTGTAFPILFSNDDDYFSFIHSFPIFSFPIPPAGR